MNSHSPPVDDLISQGLREGTMVWWLGVRLGVGLLGLSIGAVGQTCLSTVNAAKERPAAAESVVSVARLRVPEKAWKHFHKAVDAVKAHRDEEYARELAKALEVAPEFAQAYLLRASQGVWHGQYQAAVEDVLTAQRLEPGAPWASVILAGAYNGLERYGDARLVLETLHGAQADAWQTKYEMARAVIGLKDVAQSLRWSLAAFESAPATCMDARLLRANAFILAQRWNDAMVQLTTYVQAKEPQMHHADALRVLGWVTLHVQAEEMSKVTLPERVGSAGR